MPYPFIRPDEMRQEGAQPRTPGPVPGLRVTCLARGDTFFFPGGTAEAAFVLARAALFDGTLDHPRTEVAFGTKDGKVWTETHLIKPAQGPGGKGVV